MDPKIWKSLPTDLVRRIVQQSELSIDSRLAFNIPPKKIDSDRVWRLEYLLGSFHGLMYDMETLSLHNFRVRGNHIVRRPIELAWVDDGLYAFNLPNDEHHHEVTSSDGTYLSTLSRDAFFTEYPVLLKNSGPCRVINKILHP